MKLTPPMERFILHWGEMGTRWGVNRSVAQVHALLYLSPKPLNAEEIAETLSLARSNVSTSLKELQSWGLIKVIHVVVGDRRDHFEAHKDVQDMFNQVVEARRRREIDPTLTLLRDLCIEADRDAETDPEVKKRIADMLNFLEVMTNWYDRLRKLPNDTLMQLVRLGDSVVKLLKVKP
ncbi:GbsR/MarR family transcriptional regulator [Methylosarcina fibrata]|uniref:GbsR/MarR family transcriptional regulator n=1 Tax=Methylosarcina fibrata TaxID=105972 RepID=UPI00037B72CA|nr:MarR family transcriptional regulator [Methylosarcina fibrata]